MYSFTENGDFLIENYNWARPFASFFPGIAGKYGIPLWSYYVSRNQAVVSTGVRDKDGQIMEFLPFNKALDFVGTVGFRTWIKRDNRVYEPFCKTRDPEVSQEMRLSSHELVLKDIHEGCGLTTEVLYFQIPGERFPGLARRLTITNSGETGTRLEVLDGLPRILARGMDLHCVTTIARHVEGMIEVGLETGTPLYRLKQAPKDSEEVARVEGGHFYLSLDPAKGSIDHGAYFYDPAVIFGDPEMHATPWELLSTPLSELLTRTQVGQNRTPSALSGFDLVLGPGESQEIWSIIGSVTTDQAIEEACQIIAREEFFNKKREENRCLIEGIKDLSFTASADQRFDSYIGQTFLDNVIRGGMPVVFPTADSKTAFYLYSRQNGDLERDYHHFIVEPTYFSQGTGHYRSVNQNRRADTWFFSPIGDRNIVTFMNLIQFDGYNPLEITQMTYSVVKTQEAAEWLGGLPAKSPKTAELFKRLETGTPFAPGEVIMELEAEGEDLKLSRDEFLTRLLGFCRENESGAIHEGFWVDHWLYNFDLIENFLMIYPEETRELFLDNREYYFYDDPDRVVPRSEKYVLVDGTVFQYKAVVRDLEKQAGLAARKLNPLMARTKHGKGEIYRTCLLVKLLCQAANRLATIDPSGLGVEMDADKPGWNDSVNGLPGILASSLCQMLQLENVLGIIKRNLLSIKAEDPKVKIGVYSELAEFLNRLSEAVKTCLDSSGDQAADFAYWDLSNTIKEEYREKTRLGISGEDVLLGIDEIIEFADLGLSLVTRIYQPERWKRCVNPKGVPYTYFRNVVTKHEILKDKDGSPRLDGEGRPRVKALEFKSEPLPLFLEGPVHFIRLHPERAGEIYQAVKDSELYDKKLKMYKVCESLEKAPFEIGRVKAWGPGWIENESVYTHMLYKYLLELIKSGLYEEYFSDIKTMLACYLDPVSYGRSPLENVSFVVSSAFPDETQHGRGLQARLSGVTGEMINQWILMVAGPRPFVIDSADGKTLVFKPQPILPGEFFTTSPSQKSWMSPEGVENELSLPANVFAARIFGRGLIIYHNPRRKNTYGEDGVKVTGFKILWVDGRTNQYGPDELRAQLAEAIRQGQALKIEVILG